MKDHTKQEHHMLGRTKQVHRKSEHKPKHNCVSQTVRSTTHHNHDRSSISCSSWSRVCSMRQEPHKRGHRLGRSLQRELHKLEHKPGHNWRQEPHKREHMLEHSLQQELHTRVHSHCPYDSKNHCYHHQMGSNHHHRHHQMCSNHHRHPRCSKRREHSSNHSMVA